MGNEQQVSEPVDMQTTAVEITTPASVQSAVREGDLTRVRELVLKAHPDVVPDLVRGSSVDELIASVEPARSAYQRVAEQVRESRSREEQDASSTQSVVQPPQVPAGGATNVVEPADLAPATKIARALAERKKR